ncbi:S-methyl-5'-thioadenosine phosphorylase-like [Hyalella azteca]|uniref:S-methyl-5'-thioadenosine phosphorylase n=1 Tax=Hyalella azteca TaxID=294128 RepID=A0A8B7NQN4_HYAAZ|nr:S-methyl-5'-thioadenosine phosphorylase-like [Hyalella azteca]
MSTVKIGIIGGTGLNQPDLFTPDKPDEQVVTPFGDPSDTLQHGTIAGVPCVLLPRHGRGHTIHPSRVNFRANLWALKEAGCTHVLAATACGSLREEIKPGDFVTISSFIDRTYKREVTFHDGSCDGLPGILHLPMDEPFCKHTRALLQQACDAAGVKCHKEGVMVTIEGPRFSSVAESKMFRILGGDVINMTTVPEVVLARELGLCYASLAMATDYDCWRSSTEPVNVEVVMATMKSNAEKAVAVIKSAVELIAQHDWTEIIPSLKKSVTMNLMLPKC